MYVTELIKFKEYRNYLIERFPKPNIEFKTAVEPNNENPSLTGYAFEILFSLACIKKTGIERYFKNEFLRAEENTASLREVESSTHMIDKEHLWIRLSDEEYKRKVLIITKMLKGTPWLVKEKNPMMKSVRVSNLIIRDIKLISRINNETGLFLFPWKQKDCMSSKESGLVDREGFGCLS